MREVSGKPKSKAEATRAPAPARPAPALIQRKVVLGQSGDPFEREAEAAASKVVAGEPVGSVTPVGRGALGGAPQRQAAEEEEPVQMKEASEQEEPIQRSSTGAAHTTNGINTGAALTTNGINRGAALTTNGISTGAAHHTHVINTGATHHIQRSSTESSPSQEEEPVQMQGGPSAMQAAASNAIANKGSGSPMAPAVRAPLERSFGADLSHVRVHEDTRAQQAASDLNARAFTHENDIWMGPGESQADLGLMAHETAHVFQQGGVVRRAETDDDSGGEAVADTGVKRDGEAVIEFESLTLPGFKTQAHRGALYSGKGMRRNKGYNAEAREDTNQIKVWKDGLGVAAPAKTVLENKVRAAMRNTEVTDSTRFK